MEFKELENQVSENYIFRQESTCGKVEIGVWPVMFGYRVRAGFTGSLCCELDYCCGDNDIHVGFIYNYVKNIMEQQEVSRDMFRIFPRQNIKPFFKDAENYEKFCSLANDNMKIVKLPNIHAGKIEYLKKYVFNK